MPGPKNPADTGRQSSTADPTEVTDSLPGTDERTPLLGAPDTAGTKAIKRVNGQDDAILEANGNDSPAKPSSNEEEEPLLATAPVEDEVDDEPMPVVQVVILCYAALVEPVAYFSIFPIIGEMLVKTGHLDLDGIGIYAGLIESLFSVVQMCVMIGYGKLADRVGRKPVLVFSLVGVSGAAALFGLSQTLWHMIVLRCLAGVFAGSSVTIRAMLSELTTKKTQARAFSWYMFTRQLGITIGPLIGALANPTQNFPIFKGNEFFEQFPYALAMFVAGAFCFTAAIATSIVVKETLKAKDDGAKSDPPMSSIQLLKQPGVDRVIVIYGYVLLIALSYTAINPIFTFEPVDKGGFGFKPQQISIMVAVAGASQAAWMLVPFPPLQKRFGTGAVLRACAIVWPFFLGCLPILNELLRHEFYTAFWVIFGLQLIGGSGVAMAFACIQLCLNDISPSPATLGLLNAIALTVNSAIRAVAPIVSTLIYQWGVQRMWIDGHLALVLLVALAAGFTVVVRFLPAKAEGKIQQKSGDVDT